MASAANTTTCSGSSISGPASACWMSAAAGGAICYTSPPTPKAAFTASRSAPSSVWNCCDAPRPAAWSIRSRWIPHETKLVENCFYRHFANYLAQNFVRYLACSPSMDQLAGLTEGPRKLTLDRFRLLQPHLEDKAPPEVDSESSKLRDTMANVLVQRRRAELRALALYPSPSVATGCYA